MDLKDDPYSNEASSAAGRTPTPGRDQSGRGGAAAAGGTLHPALTDVYFKKCEKQESDAFLACVRPGPSAGAAAHDRPGRVSSRLFGRDHPARHTAGHDRALLLRPWTRRLVFLGPR